MPIATTRPTGGQPLLELLLLCGLRFDAASLLRSRADLPGERDARILLHLHHLQLRQAILQFHASAAGGKKRAGIEWRDAGRKNRVGDFAAKTVRPATKNSSTLVLGGPRVFESNVACVQTPAKALSFLGFAG